MTTATELEPMDIRKNATEILRVEAAEWKGYELVALRIYYEGAGGQLKPSKKGVTFRRSLLDKVVPALQAIQEADTGENLDESDEGQK